jgi:prepilin-type N-terminal cleavage/methylation domain-containing protein
MAKYLKKKRLAFTLIEVLISIVLVGIILPPLFKLITLMQDSNSQIFSYVTKQKQEAKAIETMYLDLLSSDGNITIAKNEFSRVCIENSLNSLYGLSRAKVCWLVTKEKNRLLRVEGNDYRLPLRLEDKVESDAVLSDLELFDIYRNKNDLLVIIKQKNQKPITFEIYGVHKPEKKPKKKKSKKKKPKKNTKPKTDSNTTKGLV